MTTVAINGGQFVPKPPTSRNWVSLSGRVYSAWSRISMNG